MKIYRPRCMTVQAVFFEGEISVAEVEEMINGKVRLGDRYPGCTWPFWEVVNGDTWIEIYEGVYVVFANGEIRIMHPVAFHSQFVEKYIV